MKPSFLVEFETDRWRIACFAAGVVELREVMAGADAAGAGAVKAALQQWGYRGGGVCLGLPSSLVLAAQIDCPSLPRRERASAMLYRLEEQLPLDIESLTADFLPPVGGRALGVAVRTDRVRELTGPLAEAGVDTAAICPTALLAVWQVCQAGAPCDYVLIVSSGRSDIFRLYEKRPVAWYTVADDPQELVRCIKADHLAHPVEAPQATVCVVAEAGWPTTALESEAGLKVARRHEEPVLGLAARAAGRLLADGQAGWINLCRGALAPGGAWGRLGGLLRSAVVLALVLPAVLAAVFYARGLQYADRTDQALRGQGEAYREAFPNRPAPVAVKSRLRSEAARLAGLSGISAKVPSPAGALEILRKMAAGIPPGMRVRILEIRIGPESIFIEGQARTHSDAETISRGLSGAGLAVEPPHTESLATGGVAFTLAGKPVAAGIAPPREDTAP